MDTIRKAIDLPVSIMDDLARIAAYEKRKGKYTSKALIESIVEDYVAENSGTAKVKTVKP
jgi:hypothetical protein